MQGTAKPENRFGRIGDHVSGHGLIFLSLTLYGPVCGPGPNCLKEDICFTNATNANGPERGMP
jgi:hypothetical protein